MTENNDRRRHNRYNTEVDISFQVTYDIKTKVDYQILNKEDPNPDVCKYSALSRNVSVNGIRFVSDRLLNVGDKLYLEVYVPSSKTPVEMIGEVRWSRNLDEKDSTRIDTGVQIEKVNDLTVNESIYFDQEYRVEWSEVLESVLGSYRILAQEKAKEKEKE